METQAKKDKDYVIVVNGTPVTVEDEIVTYEQLGEIAYRGTIRRRSSPSRTATPSPPTGAAVSSSPAGRCA